MKLAKPERTLHNRLCKEKSRLELSQMPKLLSKKIPPQQHRNNKLCVIK